jgi:hypothetical protein
MLPSNRRLTPAKAERRTVDEKPASPSAFRAGTPKRLFAQDLLTQSSVERVPDAELELQMHVANPFSVHRQRAYSPIVTMRGDSNFAASLTLPRSSGTLPVVGSPGLSGVPLPPPSRSYARRLLLLKPGQGRDADTAQESLDGICANGRTIPLATYLIHDFLTHSSDTLGANGLDESTAPRPTSPLVYLSSSMQHPNRPATRADGPSTMTAPSSPLHNVVDRDLLFSRERYQHVDRQALRSRAKTPAQIQQWQDSLPLPLVREVIRGRNQVPVSAQLAARIAAKEVERQHQRITEHLEHNGIRFHETRATEPVLATALANAEHTASRQHPSADAKSGVKTGGAKHNSRSIVRSLRGHSAAIKHVLFELGLGDVDRQRRGRIAHRRRDTWCAFDYGATGKLAAVAELRHVCIVQRTICRGRTLPAPSPLSHRD